MFFCNNKKNNMYQKEKVQNIDFSKRVLCPCTKNKTVFLISFVFINNKKQYLKSICQHLDGARAPDANQMPEVPEVF